MNADTTTNSITPNMTSHFDCHVQFLEELKTIQGLDTDTITFTLCTAQPHGLPKSIPETEYQLQNRRRR